jgi:hypothetical protein
MLLYVSVSQKKILEAQWNKPVSLTCHFALRKFDTEPSKGASYQISINLAKWFERRFFQIGQSQARTAYGGHISCMNGTKYKKCCTGSLTYHCYKVTIHCGS